MLQAGNKAPEFSLPDQDGDLHRLQDYRGKKVLLYFYPRDDTPGCTKEACHFRDDFVLFEERGFVILGVSDDPVSSHRKFAQKFGLPFPLLADPDKNVIRAYGALTEKNFFGKRIQGTKRISFLMDEEGIILQIVDPVNPETHSREVLGLE